MAKDNTISYIILGLLMHEDMTGYDIKKRIDSNISYFWSAGFGQIYPTLKVLVNEGFVSKKSEAGIHGNERIIYSITQDGRNKLVKWLTAPAEKEYVKYEILLKLFFGKLLPIDESIRKIDEFRKKYEKNLAHMDNFEASLINAPSQEEDHFYYLLTVLFGKHVYKAYVSWADEAVKLLNNHKERS
ncbi:MAG: PadR family transcriptional regulator [Clostridia bacterium]|nr:PadR family transcriptional regulator [Clostridia bacterium]